MSQQIGFSDLSLLQRIVKRTRVPREQYAEARERKAGSIYVAAPHFERVFIHPIRTEPIQP